MNALTLRHVSLAEIIRRCQEEARLARDKEEGHCFELFQRALGDRQPGAWEALQQQYQRLVLGWLHKASDLTPDEVDDLAHDAWQKFWCSLGQRASDLSAHFQHVGALLNYLHQCAITTLLDQQRRQQRQERLLARLSEMQANVPTPLTPADLALDELQRAERLTQAQQWAASQVNDPQEKLILVLSFEQDLLPADIAARFPAEFPDVQTVRRIKERLLKRARRALA